MLCASAHQFEDWSAAYRLFEQERFDREALFAPVLREVLERLEPDQPLVAMMDDTLLRKRGRKVYGAGWRSFGGRTRASLQGQLRLGPALSADISGAPCGACWCKPSQGRARRPGPCSFSAQAAQD